ncbi:AAA family ATPase [Cronobacter dublinensis]
MAKIIVIGGTKGGPGKSTVAQQLAGALVLKKQKKCHLTDIDGQMTTAGWAEERRENEDLALIPFDFVDYEVVKHINAVSQRYDFVVIDAGGFDSEIQRQAMQMADIILLPFRPKRRDIKSLRNLDPVLDNVRNTNHKVRILGVMNQCPSLPNQAQRIINAKGVIESFGIEPVPVNLYTRNVYDDAEESGRTIFEMTGSERDQKAEAEIIELVDYLLSLEDK